MIQEQLFQKSIAEKLNIPLEQVQITRQRRLSLEVPYANFWEALDYIVRELKFNIFCSLTGLDEADKLSAIYHIAHENGTVLNLKTSLERNNPIMKTVTGYFPSAEVMERELVDLFGFKVQGLPPGARYPLTDDWPKDEFPLRKDWRNTHA
jgi:membrane-bound hydrogenase subunit beta